jgi:putative ABC transport system ATP-binding protein
MIPEPIDTPSKTVVALRDVRKHYPTPGGEQVALAGIDLDIARGEFVAIVGASGSGKSTLLNLLGGIDRATAGSHEVAGVRLNRTSERELSRFRARSIGFVFQFFQLLPTLTALENVLLPMAFARHIPSSARERRGRDLLDRLGVADQANKLPATLSGGQQQRVAVARALANDPELLLADEPTGNLDSHNASSLIQLLGALSRTGHTIVLVTHEAAVVREATRAIRLVDGRVAGNGA